MTKRTIELGRALVEVEERQGYLLIVESGRLQSLGDVRRYQAEVDRLVRDTGLNKALIDARGEVGEPETEVRDAMWEWLLDPNRSFEVAAFVLPAGMAVARVNMTALSRGANLRAFETVSAAQRWLARGGRPTAGNLRRSTSVPAPVVSETAPTLAPPAPEAEDSSSSGSYDKRGAPAREPGDDEGGSSSVA